jgi:RHS repeat-associated protein
MLFLCCSTAVCLTRFTGKERDGETGLDYFGARYMSSAQGRFMSPEAPFADQKPEDPQSWNLYGYVRNNPLRFIDPTGRCSAPAVKQGETGICIDTYIAARKVGGPGDGDNRGPAPNDPKATYRQEIQIAVNPTSGSVRLVKNDAGVSSASIGPIPLTGSVKGTSETAISSQLTTHTNDDGNRMFGVVSEGVNGLAGLPFSPKESIKTAIDFSVTPDGKIGIDGGSRTAFPSIEIYSYDSAGKPTTLLQIKESGNVGDLCCRNQPIHRVKPR